MCVYEDLSFLSFLEFGSTSVLFTSNGLNSTVPPPAPAVSPLPIATHSAPLLPSPELLHPSSARPSQGRVTAGATEMMTFTSSLKAL